MSYFPKKCPNSSCLQTNGFSKKGFHYVKHLNQKFRIFQCKSCRRYFTSRTFRLDYRQKRSDLNAVVAKDIAEGKSLRAIGRSTGLTYNNVYRKFLWLKKVTDKFQDSLKYAAKTLQFDELETIEHTKCKPLHIVLAVNEKHQMLSAKVAIMPAKGRLAELSRKKYGLRDNQRIEKLGEVFSEVCSRLVAMPILIKSDSHPTYRLQVERFFPGIEYRQYLRPKKKKLQERLHEKVQKKKFDPIFSVNHNCALLRDRIKRLARRNWCTTKKIENLQLNLDVFIMYRMTPKSALKRWDLGGFG